MPNSTPKQYHANHLMRKLAFHMCVSLINSFALLSLYLHFGLLGETWYSRRQPRSISTPRVPKHRYTEPKRHAKKGAEPPKARPRSARGRRGRKGPPAATRDQPCIGRSLYILPHERVLSNVPSMEAPIEVCVEIETPKPYLALHAKPSPPHTGIQLFGVQRHGNGAGLAMAWV